MRDDKPNAKESRRDFLKLAGVGTLAAGAAAVAGEPVPAAEVEADGGEGYRETKHVKTYYALARF